MAIYDLIYCGDDMADFNRDQSIIKKNFPDATIKDASDEIHQYRFSVELQADETEWYTFLFIKGLALLSFSFQMAMQDEEKMSLFKKILEENKNKVEKQ